MHRIQRKSLSTNKVRAAKRLVGTLGLACVVGLFGGCANTKKDKQSWHNMPTSFTAPPMQSSQQAGAESSKNSVFDKFQEALKLRPKVLQVDDPTSLESKAKIDDPSIYLVTARMCAQKNQYDAATDNYQRALEIDPGNLDATMGIGQVLQTQGKYDEAIEVYRRAMNDHPQEPQLASSIGNCLLMMNEPDKAIKVFEAVVEQDPANPLYREQLALVLVKQDDEQSAYAQLAAVLPPAQAAMSMGKIQARLGHRAEAIERLESAFQQDNTLVEAFDLAQALKGRTALTATEPAPFHRPLPAEPTADRREEIAMMSAVSEQPLANSLRLQPVAVPSTDARNLENREAEFKKTMDLLNQKLAAAEANQPESSQPESSQPPTSSNETQSVQRFKVESYRSPFGKIDASSTLKSILR